MSMGQKGWSGEELHWACFCTKGKQLTATLITGLLLLVQKGGSLLVMKSFDKYFMTQSKPQDMKSSNEQSYFSVKGVDGSFY